MIIKNIEINNYRGIVNLQQIPLNRFSSFVGKNDAGKSIVLNAIATFLNPKNYPITVTDFNNLSKPIEMTCKFYSEHLKDTLEENIKSKKTDGLHEFINDILINGELTVRKTIKESKKDFDSKQILILDYKEQDFQFLYKKSDEDLNSILNKYNITAAIQGKGRNSKIEKIKYIKKYCDLKGLEKHQIYIDDEFKICSLLPSVELFRADYGLETDTRFKSSSVSEILQYLEEESTEGKKLSVIESEISCEMQKEASSVKRYMHEYVPNLKEIEIKPSISWKDAIKSVDVSFQFDGDSKPILMSHKGTGYRRLFMVARFRYLAEKSKALNIIYLIEESRNISSSICSK